MPIDITPTATGRAFKFAALGDKVEGVIISAEERPQTDIQTGETKTWSDGNPMMQWVIVLATDLRDAEIPDDDGHRAIYAKGGKATSEDGKSRTMQAAIIDAVKAAGAKVLEEGGTLAVAYTADGTPSARGFSPPKLYKARYAPPAKGVSVDPF